MESMFDGIQRPLDAIRAIAGNFLTKGVYVSSLDRKRKWNFVPTAKVGDEVSAGFAIGTVVETSVITQTIMIPNGISGTITS